MTILRRTVYEYQLICDRCDRVIEGEEGMYLSKWNGSLYEFDPLLENIHGIPELPTIENPCIEGLVLSDTAEWLETDRKEQRLLEAPIIFCSNCQYTLAEKHENEVAEPLLGKYLD